MWAALLVSSSLLVAANLDWPELRRVYEREAPELAGSSLEVDGRILRLRLAGRERLDPTVFDHLLATLTPLFGRDLALVVTGPDGESLDPAGLSPEWLDAIGPRWHAHRGVRPKAVGGPLAGVRIAISAGHGIQFKDGAWSYQRGVLFDVREDQHTNEIVFRHLVPLLERMGAEVIPVRERTAFDERVLVDNEPTSEGYDEVGAFEASPSPGYDGGTYRFAYVTPSASPRATWTFSVPRAAELPLYVWFLPSPNRTTEARYEIHHGGTTSVVVIDQTLGDARWVYLGTFAFPAGESSVSLVAVGDTPNKVVVADALRLGGGAGFIDFGGGESGQLRWHQSASTHAVEELVPSAVRSGTNDVTMRPAWALWQGADIFLAVHTNAAGGRGTSTFIYSNAVAYPGFDPDRATPVPPGTKALQELVHAALLEEYRRWEADWDDRGLWGANFGELRPITQAWEDDPSIVMPATLVELAFHDEANDARLLREDRFRAASARALARGLLRYVRGASPAMPIAAPPPGVVNLRRLDGELVLGFIGATDPVDATIAGAAPYGFVVSTSRDGRTFEDPFEVDAAPVTLPGEPCELWAARVEAVNAAGQSLPSAMVLGRRIDHAPRMLWVDGTRRLVRSALERADGPSTGARLFEDLLASPSLDHLAVESGRAESVGTGEIDLAPYDLVLWTTGETSSADTSLSASELVALEAYVAAGGSLIMSGSEIGWDLVALGSVDEAATFERIFRTDYVQDDAGTYAVGATVASPWLGDLPAFSFDDGSGLSFRVDYPDVLAPSAAAGGDAWIELSYEGGTGGGAAIAYEGVGRVFFAGFPLESIEDDSARRTILARLIEAMVPDLADAPGCEPTPVDDGGPLPGDPGPGGDDDSPQPTDQAPPPGGDSDLGPGILDPGTPAGCDCRSTPGVALWAVALMGAFVGLRRRRSGGGFGR